MRLFTYCLLCRTLAEKEKEVMFVRPKKLIRTSGTEALGYVDIRTLAEGMCRYDLNEQDVAWLQIANEQFAEMGESPDGFGRVTPRIRNVLNEIIPVSKPVLRRPTHMLGLTRPPLICGFRKWML